MGIIGAAEAQRGTNLSQPLVALFPFPPSFPSTTYNPKPGPDLLRNAIALERPLTSRPQCWHIPYLHLPGKGDRHFHCVRTDGNWTEITDLKLKHEENFRLPSCLNGTSLPPPSLYLHSQSTSTFPSSAL